ncbi:MAG: penicillin-binding protein 2 [Chitinophagaceae bacterium]|jgi:penicillin-binding protein 2|nr:penicillin-binding protein 2 [Chitinophagaceae bacterium]
MSDFNAIRTRVIQIAFAAAFFIIIVQLFNLQILSGKYSRMADDQAIYRKVVYPNRGLVYDRTGKVILDNTILYDLVVIPSQLRGTDTAFVCNILNIDTAEFRKRVVNAIVKNGRYRPSVFEGLLDDATYARLQERLYTIQPGFDLQQRPIRKYPYEAAAHVFGYLGEVDPQFLERHADEGYRMGDYTGLTGLERYYEKSLMGQRGIEFWLKDKMNRPTQRYENGMYDTAMVAGSTMYSSIDIELQQFGEQLMANKIGSMVAIDPRTGGIIAMVNAPSYSPSLLTGSQRRAQFSRMYVDPMKPLYNRAITGEYSPGSTFKTLQAVIGMQEGVITDSSGYPCPGRYNGCGNGKPGCHGGGHAGNLKSAIAVSCNSYFAHVFRKIIDQPRYGTVDSGLAVWAKHMADFGLGHRLGVDIPGERPGLIPTAPRYVKTFGPRWNSCNVVSVSIGQGEVNSTILQLANAIAMIANKGWYYTPHVVDSIEGGDKFGLLAPFKKKIKAADIPDHMFEAVHEGMDAVVQGPTGTARRMRIEGVVMCGKTGTVENYYRGKKQRDHSFFAAFAPRQNPTIAIACIVENGGFGGTVAAPIVSLMIEKYLHDTISKARQPWIERYAGMRIIPARVQAEIDKADSVRRVKEAEKLRLFKEARPVAAVSKPGLPDDLPAKKPNPTPKGRLQAWVQRHPYTAGNWHEPVANHTL